MKNNNPKIIYLFIMVGVTLTFIVIYLILGFLGLNYEGQYEPLYPTMRLERVYDNGKVEPLKDGDNTIFLDKGEKVVLRGDFPVFPRLSTGRCLSFVSYTTAYRFECADKIVAEKDMDKAENGIYFPRKVNFLSIPGNIRGKKMTMTFVGGKNGAKIKLDTFYFGDAYALYKLFLVQRNFALLLSIALATFGIILIVLNVILGIYLRGKLGNIFLGIVLIVLGAYLASYNNLAFVFGISFEHSGITEYFTLMSLPVIILINVIITNKKYLHPSNLIISQAGVIAVVIAFVLHILKLRNINEMVVFIYVFSGLNAIYLLLWIHYIKKKERNSIGSELYGNIAKAAINEGYVILIVFALLDIVIHGLNFNGFIPLNENVRGTFLMLGSSMFAASIFVSYFYHTIASLEQDDIEKELEWAAYTDKLTSLANRAYCDSIIADYSKEKRPCTVFSFDLDRLKIVNDALGHQKGDRYISGFAHVLKENFEQAALIGRMGGDEFIVIINGEDMGVAREYLNQLANRVSNLNFSEADTEYEYSYGCANTSETENHTARECYLISDQRMYEMKKIHHGDVTGKEVRI
ncbi:MAG: diguanylate cyclase [Lachnospiraceae bacterium]|nr:diguanylate cyclase [Lachnospiraceae bacterium]